jgi:cytochrome P450
MTTTTGTSGDLSVEARLDDTAFYLGDPYPTYARLRHEAPVYWCESGRFWALSKHEDVMWAELQGNPPLTAEQGLYIAEAARPALTAERDLGGAQQSGGSFMSDPPGHTRFRRMISGAFTPEALKSLEPKIRSIAAGLLDQLPAGEVVEFVEAVSVPLSLRVICEFLGVPPDDQNDLRRWADSFMAMIGGNLPEGSPEAAQAIDDLGQMNEYFLATLKDRKTTPRDDLMSTVASLELDGEPLPEASQFAICMSVLSAGNETTRNTMSGAMVTFAEHPEQWDTLLAEPAYIENATDELLRWINPVLHFGRRATEPVTIRDQTIAEGEFIVMLYASANRDEDVWPDPDVFDVTRPLDHKQLSFGWGLHRCIGAGLARAEIGAVLDGLRERFRGWELSGSPERHPSTLVTDYRQVPITLVGV